MSDKLKPCPFCGGEGEVCVYAGPVVVDCKDQVDCGGSASLEFWNQRSDTVKALEEVRAEVQKRDNEKLKEWHVNEITDIIDAKIKEIEG